MEKSNQLDRSMTYFLTKIKPDKVWFFNICEFLDSSFGHLALYRFVRGGFWRSIDVSSTSARAVRFIRLDTAYVEKYNHYLKTHERSPQISISGKSNGKN